MDEPSSAGRVTLRPCPGVESLETTALKPSAAEVGRRQAVAAAAARATLARACLPTFVEPFCGALAVTFGLQPDRALLNHANPHVIYRTPAREVLAVRNL